MAEVKALRQVREKDSAPYQLRVYIPAQTFLMLLTAAQASAHPSRESGAPRGGGNGGKGCNLF